jgi:hypothetical protein
MPSEAATLGAAGEHYVLFQLLRRGFIAALAPHGVPMADIILSNRLGTKLCAGQVKTRSGIGADGGWHMNVKHETIREPSLFYCFVDLRNDEKSVPDVYVVPSEVVATVISETYQAWVAAPGKNGRVRKQHKLRRFVPDYTRYDCPKYSNGWLTAYRNSWDLLKGKNVQHE